MSLKFYNPPTALLSKGTKMGVEIGGSLCVLAMDQEQNLHNVKTIFSELSWNEFWKDEEISDQIESITVMHDDTKSLFNPDELLNRLIDAFNIIQARQWIFFGLADFESNSFQQGMFIEGLDYQYIKRLMQEHKRIRDHSKFPELINEQMLKSGNAFIYSKFYGRGSDYIHYQPDTTLYTIFNKTKSISGNIAGIVCTSEGAANFYILSENVHLLIDRSEYRIDVKTLEYVFEYIKKNIIFPISWFKINIGLASLKILEQWDQIKDNDNLKKTLFQYFKYVNSTLKEIHDKIELRKKDTDELQEIKIEELSQKEKEIYIKTLDELLQSEDLGLFKK